MDVRSFEHPDIESLFYDIGILRAFSGEVVEIGIRLCSLSPIVVCRCRVDNSFTR